MNRDEKNAEIIRLRKSGMKLDDIAKKMGETPSNVRNVVYRARSDELVEMEMAKYQTLFDENRALKSLKARVSVGDTVKVYGAGWTVCEVYPNIVLSKNLKNRPCLNCAYSGGDCERLCRQTFEPRRLFDICKTYWKWFDTADRCTPMYQDISRVKG